MITVIPDVRNILKSESDNIARALSGRCIQSKIYRYPSQLRSSQRAVRERNILLHENANNCQFHQPQITENLAETVAETKQFLAVLPKAENFKIICKDRVETDSLISVFPMKQGSCKIYLIYFRNQQLLLQEMSHCSPLVRQNPSKVEVNLKELKSLNELHLTPAMLIVEATDTDLHYLVPSG